MSTRLESLKEGLAIFLSEAQTVFTIISNERPILRWGIVFAVLLAAWFIIGAIPFVGGFLSLIVAIPALAAFVCLLYFIVTEVQETANED
jgi:CHASE2 domain-containing sensor protein